MNGRGGFFSPAARFDAAARLGAPAPGRYWQAARAVVALSLAAVQFGVAGVDNLPAVMGLRAALK